MARANTFSPWSAKSWTVESFRPFLPKITIGVLNYNRKNDLRRTLDCLMCAIQYPDFEVIVVDNASVDGSVEMVIKEFPNVRVIISKNNVGTSARNLFYENAKGKYIFSYDDDSFPATPATIHHVVTFLEERSECDALSFSCYQPKTGFMESGNPKHFRFSGSETDGYEGLFFVEGGMCIRASAWKKIKGYDSDFVWGAEGADLTLQMYAEDMKTMLHPGFATLHMKSNDNRIYSKNMYFFTRNYIWTIAKHFPLYASVLLVFFYILRRFVAIALHPRAAAAFLNGMKDGVLGIPAQRKKIRKLGLRQVLGLKRWYLFLYRW
jgi:GT2 family glycosyltransferase